MMYWKYLLLRLVVNVIGLVCICIGADATIDISRWYFVLVVIGVAIVFCSSYFLR